MIADLPPQILYWKWNDADLNRPALVRKAEDMCQRSDFNLFYVSFHWVDHSFFDPEVQQAVREAAQVYTQHGRGFMLDVDPRTEGDAFAHAHPGELAGFIQFDEATLDTQGRAAVSIAPVEVQRFGRKRQAAADSVVAAWAFRPAGDTDYEAASLADITCACRCEPSADGILVRIDAGSAQAGKRVLFFPRFVHVTPDPFSPHFDGFVHDMFKRVADVPLAGAAWDEWGISPIFHSDAQGLYFREIPYSGFMDETYARRYGSSLRSELLHLRYGPTSARIRAIDRYLENLRDRMAANERALYREGKATFGPKTFIAAHPTWWGDSKSFYLEVFNNGLHWWQAQRDYGQTDESIMLPIRLALAHRWGGRVWYNMFYSANTGRVDTYYPETWSNARWGGRTHYLGYECPNEPGVCTLAAAGRLEAVSRMEKRISELNTAQQAAPDSRVLVLFGMEACTNWDFTPNRNRIFRDDSPRLRRMLAFTQEIFDAGYLCDLVPTSEIVDGALMLDHGKPRYGNQTYDAVVLLEPEAMRADAYPFLQRLAAKTPLFVIGDAQYLADGAPAATVFARLRGAAHARFDAYPLVATVTAQFQALHVPGNHFVNGCVLQDGSLLFTAEGRQPIGNPLHVDVVYRGHRIQFDGEDYLLIAIDDAGHVTRHNAGATKRLVVN